MRNNRKSLVVLLGFTFTLLTLVFSAEHFNQFAQDRNGDYFKSKMEGEKSTDLDLDESQARKTVIEFWRFAESGDFVEAGKRTTNRSNGFTFVVENSSGKFEEAIFNSEYHFLAIEQVEVKELCEYEIAVKVKNKIGREFNLFHTVVKSDDGWKIFSTSF